MNKNTNIETSLLERCQWVTSDPLYINYHDEEWGVPIYDERLLFEFIILEGMQAGLSWFTVLKKRDNFRIAFDHFNPEAIAQYDQTKRDQLLQNAGIIRNRLKIEATITNAKALLNLRNQGKKFSDILWDFVDHKPLVNHWQDIKKIPAKTDISDKMSKQLTKLGFKFVGSTICYAFMQAVGMVNDHTQNCFRFAEVNSKLSL